MADSIDALVAALAKELQATAKPEPIASAAPTAPTEPVAPVSPAVKRPTRVPADPVRYTRSDYPMLQRHADSIRTPTGKPLSALTLDAVLAGDVVIGDVRISKEMLYAQGDIAADAGKPAMGESLRRAAELTQVPDDRIIKMYDLLRPHRATKAELEAMAGELQTKYSAPMCAMMVREAAVIYEARRILKED